MFIGDDEINIELLKSDAYGKDDLITLLTTPKPQIKLKRHCTGFMVAFMFTNVDERHGGAGNNRPSYYVDEYNWEDFLPNTNPNDFYLKLYVGPNFCHTYDIYNNKVPDDDQGGYYVINNNQYTQLTGYQCITGGLSGDGYSYTGFGYRTLVEGILLAPLNTAMDLNNFAIYAFVKYAPDGTNVNSDEGSFYLKIPLEDMTFTLNRIHKFILAIDINKLKEVIEKTNATNTFTRGFWNTPIQLELGNHIKMIDIQE